MAWTVPTPSCPGTNGGAGLTGQSPFAAWMSVWHSPEATMRTVSCPGPGPGTGRSSITSGWPNWRTTAAFIVPPRSLESPGQPDCRRSGQGRGVGHAACGPKVPAAPLSRPQGPAAWPKSPVTSGRKSHRGVTCGPAVPTLAQAKLMATQNLQPDRGPGRMKEAPEMRRRTFDALATMAGVVLAVVLAVGGGLLLWGHSVISNDVHTQLAAQKIVFPPANSAPIKELPAADAAAMNQYGGQLMTTGAQAETYANHFIAVHLTKIGGGQTYSQLSGKSLAQPKNTALADQVQTMFRGTTLRGLLLNAYGWWQMGQIMLISAFVAFGSAVLFLILSGLGFWHLRRTAPQSEVFPKAATKVPAHTA